VTKLVDAMKAVHAAPAPAAVRREKMNAQELKNLAVAWNSSPLRDPFKRRSAFSEKSAREQLTLTGILRQTDSELAVINNQIIAVGETILGFKIESVEADRVWVSGPNDREVIEFKISASDVPPKEVVVANATFQSAQLARLSSANRTQKTDRISVGAHPSRLLFDEGTGHWIDHVMDSGRLIRLEDGSVWRVSPIDVIDSMLWLPISNITVIDGDDPSYPHKLVNMDDNEVVNAKLLQD
jgi:hypothetical protein